MAVTVVENITQSTTPSLHLVRDVSSILAEYNPDLYPLDTLLRQAGMGEKAQNTKVEFEFKTILDRKLTVNGTVGGGASPQNVIVVSSANIRVDDLLIAPVGYDLTKPVLRVLANNTSTNTLSVQAISGSAVVAVPAIADRTVLAFVSNAKAEGFSASKARTTMPDLEYNFCQNFDALVKISGTRKNTKNYTKADWDAARAEQLGEFRRSLNNAMFFGQRAELTDTVSGEKIWTMGGTRQYLTKTFNYIKPAVAGAAAISEGIIMDWLRDVFSGNNGSPTRILFADSYLSAEIQKSQLSKTRNLEKVTIAGIRCTKLEFNEGTLLLKHCRDFNEIGFNHYGQILDMKQIKKKILQPMERNPLKLREQGQNLDAEQYIEQSTLEVRNPSCHAEIIGTLAS